MVNLSHVDLEITGNCNMSCLHCCQKSYLSQSTDLKPKEIISLIKEMKKLGVKTVGISGGEPFARPDLFSLLDCFEKNNISVAAILTNGLLLNNGNIKKILALKTTPTCFVSLDGLDPAVFEMRGYKINDRKKVLEIVLSNIDAAIKSKIPVMINTVIVRHNVKNLLRMYHYLKEIGVLGWRLALPNQVGAYIANISKLNASLKEVFKGYLNLIKYHLKIINRGGRKFHLQVQYCFRMEVFENFQPLLPTDFICDYEGKRESCCIKPNGDVLPCSLDFDFVMGNIRYQSLKEIWQSEKMQKIKNTKLCEIEGCQSCKYLAFCGTGCRANAFFISGSRKDPDTNACAASRFFVEAIMPLLKNNGMAFKF